MGGEVVYGETLPSSGGLLELLLFAFIAMAIVHALAYRELIVEKKHPLFQTSSTYAYPERDGGLDGESIASATSANRRCPHCGTENSSDSAFEYCRNCTKPLL